MNTTAWHEEPIARRHDREAFDCGEEALNEFLRRHARQSHDSGGAKTFLAIDDADHKAILGFYSLSPASVDYARTPAVVRRGLARHDVPGFRLDSFCLPPADAACWQRPRLAASSWSSMPRMKRWRHGTPAMVRYRCWMHRYVCCCRLRRSRLR